MLKQDIIEAIQILPDNVTWDDVMYYLYVNQKISKGLKDIEAGALYSQEEAQEKLRIQ